MPNVTHKLNAAFRVGLYTPRGRVTAIAPVLLLLAASCTEKKADYTGPYAKQVAQAVPAIEAAVGLKFKHPPKVESRSKPQVREFVTAQITDPLAAKTMAGITAAYKQLGMIPDTLDLQKFLIDLLEEQIVGYYDPKTRVLYVVSDAPKDAAGVTITHELVHALQDQYISLDSTQKVEGENDRQSAAQAVFEGQAVYEQISAMLGGTNVAMNLPGGWDRVREMIRENQASMPVFARAPVVIQETLIFPYLSGAEFVRNYKDRSSGKPLYEDMPVSTEQILHPSAFFGKRDAPTRITLPPLRGVTATYQNTFGEFETRLFLFQHLKDQNEAVQGATGWDGDRYALFNTPRGQGIVWATVWDSQTDASEFFDAIGKAVEKRYATSTSAPAGSVVRAYSANGRTIEVSTVEVAGRPVVIYVDVPNGVSASVLDAAQLRLEP
ncbi:MAG TPA: hypothetical protein VHM24_04555 [Gemmatimonadaceae bacterium]|nr:hypothetical protein [Gemmatimonadaceae bacterium]